METTKNTNKEVKKENKKENGKDKREMELVRKIKI